MGGGIVDRLAGRALGPYDLEELLGSGGMGAVYRATHRRLGQPRALKVLPPSLALDQGLVARFDREANLAAGLQHPNIVQIHDIGAADGFHYIAMQLVEGVSLRQRLGADGPLPLAAALPLLRQLAEALEYAHARGVVHCDLKPANILVGPSGRVTLVDFGIARAVGGPGPTAGSMAAGTPEYMAPESVGGQKKGPSVDQYALGVVAYEMLTGQVPFARDNDRMDSMAVLFAQVHTPPPPPSALVPAIPSGLDAILLKQLAKDPSQRYPSSVAFVEALQHLDMTMRPTETNLSYPLSGPNTPGGRLQGRQNLAAPRGYPSLSPPTATASVRTGARGRRVDGKLPADSHPSGEGAPAHPRRAQPFVLPLSGFVTGVLAFVLYTAILSVVHYATSGERLRASDLLDLQNLFYVNAACLLCIALALIVRWSGWKLALRISVLYADAILLAFSFVSYLSARDSPSWSYPIVLIVTLIIPWSFYGAILGLTYVAVRNLLGRIFPKRPA
jgi:serine/threonine protein kinase